MKGLLLKDLLMAKKYCRSYVIFVVVFLLFANSGNFFFLAYPCILCGAIPVTLLAYDERSRWLQYSCTLPYSRKQIVSAKYILGVSIQIAVLIISAAVMAFKMNREGNFSLPRLLFSISVIFLVSALTSSVNLPLMFKLGVEKGRVWYYIMIGSACALGVLVSGYFTSGSSRPVPDAAFPVVFFLLGILMYFISWLLAVKFFMKREI